ncbi:MAG TPA: MgtC/SapB family protein [Ktedonobacterales bacterium]|nr:MgtC/SapB family protein [Ktedonobacterales bacterium]
MTSLGLGDVVVRLGVALALGALVGVEREYREHAAGLKTLSLVSLGASLITIASAFGFADVLGARDVTLDPSRIAAQIVSGIGFLGAGTILLRKQLVRGLTTAASIWLVAGIGLACGAGLLAEAAIATAFALIMLTAVRPMERHLFPRRTLHALRMRVEPPSATGKAIHSVYEICARMGVDVESIETERGRNSELLEVRCRVSDRDALLRAAVLIRELAEISSVRADLRGARVVRGGRAEAPLPAHEEDEDEEDQEGREDEEREPGRP